jgi:hypothetical protein
MVEAAACGIPVMAVDYSAMSSVIHNIDGIPIKVGRMFREPETHCYRAYPDNEHFVECLYNFLSKPESIRKQIAQKTYLKCRRNYDWDKTTRKWEQIFDSLPPIDNWQAPPRIIEPNLNIPIGMNNEEFVQWCVVNIWNESSMLNNYIVARMIRDLNNGIAISGYGGIFYNEDSYISKVHTFRKFTHEDVVAQLMQLNELRNYWEQRRVGTIQEEVPAFIRMKKT